MPPPDLVAHLAEGQHDPNNGASARAELQRFKDFYPLLDLPHELQVKILCHTLVSESPLEISSEFPYKPCRCDLSSQLLLVSKQFYDLARPLLYGKNVFKIGTYGVFNTTGFLKTIGSNNRDLINHVVVGVPYKQTLADRHQVPDLAQVLKSVSVLELHFNWLKVHPNKRKTELADYKPALKALAMIFRIGKRGYCYKNLERVVVLPSSPVTALLPRVKLVRENYQLKQGETIVDVNAELERLG